MANQPAMYDVCKCNHESMLHNDRSGSCFFDVPIGHKLFRGMIPRDTKTEKCGCKKFKFDSQKTANPKPTVQGDD